MAETIEQYIARILGNVEGKDPLDVLQQTPKRLSEIVTAAAGAIDFRSAPGKWSIREQVAHLADAETVIAARIRWAIAEPGAAIVAYDQDKWAAASKYASIPVEESLSTFIALRASTLAFLQRVTPQERANAFVLHSERGKETLDRILTMTAGHDINHLQQMTALLSAARGKTTGK